jgi:hypothetical protein
MNNTNGADVMMQVEKQQLPTAFAHSVNVDSPPMYSTRTGIHSRSSIKASDGISRGHGIYSMTTAARFIHSTPVPSSVLPPRIFSNMPAIK